MVIKRGVNDSSQVCIRSDIDVSDVFWGFLWEFLKRLGNIVIYFYGKISFIIKVWFGSSHYLWSYLKRMVDGDLIF